MSNELQHLVDNLNSYTQVNSKITIMNKKCSELRSERSNLEETIIHQIKDLSLESKKLKIQDKYATKYCNFIDGIRIDLNIGWFLIRASNTENCLIIRIDGNTKENFVNLSKEVNAFLKSEQLSINYNPKV